MNDASQQAATRRVAVIGAGPAGFYATEALLNADDGVAVDLFDRLPAPYGLVRYGVAPDHQNIKAVIKLYEKIAARPGFRYFGNVEYGRDLNLADLQEHYDQVVFSVGAPTDRRLGIAGEDLDGSASATEFVAWYNGHPDFVDRTFRLDHERAVVVGVGNVAMDVARILIQDRARLDPTDMTDEALAALRAAPVREVVLLARRGPAEAAFSPKEIKEIGDLDGVDLRIDPGGVDLDEIDVDALDRDARKNVEYMRERAAAPPSNAPRRVLMRFCVSPIEIHGSARVEAVTIEHNELVADDTGRIRPRGTGQTERLDAGMIFRAVGYKGVALEGLPFDDGRGVVPNDAGRVLDPDTGQPLPGLYVAGWIKRGPTGLIGTNKPDAVATVASMNADADGATAPARPDVAELLRTRGVVFVSFPDWSELDRQEVARGEARGKVRQKFLRIKEMLDALGAGAAS